MHNYLVDESVRNRVFIIAAALAIGSARLFNLIITNLNFNIPWWVETPSVLGFFGIYVWLYDNWLWNKIPFRKLRWFQIPDLQGKWDVIIKSSYKGFEEQTKAQATIRQTGNRMCITLQTAQSSSFSTYGAIARVDRQNNYELIYHYQNRPNPDSLETMSIHYGTAWIQIADNVQTMDGEYYSGRGRQHFGTILFFRAGR